MDNFNLTQRKKLYQDVEAGNLESVKSAIEGGWPKEETWSWTMGGKYFGMTIADAAKQCTDETKRKEIIDYLASV